MCPLEEDGRKQQSRAFCERAAPGLWHGRGNSRKEPALRPTLAGAGSRGAAFLRLGERGLARVQSVAHPCPHQPFTADSPPSRTPHAGSADSAPSRDPACAGPRIPALPCSLLARPATIPMSLSGLCGSSERGPQLDFPFSPGFPDSMPDMSWRKPIYPNGECSHVPGVIVHVLSILWVTCRCC